MKIRNVLAISILSFIPLCSSAGTHSSKIFLNGGVIAPNHDVEILFNNLLESVAYKVSCEITSDNKAKQENDYVALNASDHKIQPVMNGTSLNQLWQTKISAKDMNELTLYGVTSASASMVIRNLDDTDTLTVKNCYALPQVWE